MGVPYTRGAMRLERHACLIRSRKKPRFPHPLCRAPKKSRRAGCGIRSCPLRRYHYDGTGKDRNDGHQRDVQPGVVLVDTRPAADYWAGHLAGARHFDPFPFHHSGTGEAGMNEFRSQLAWIFSALGITGGETVVFYESESGMRAARGAWLLEYMGHPSLRILDGGLNQITDAELVTTPPII